MIYHFAPSLLSGGFAGVDIFFVISGFLMTGIVCNALQEGRFSPTGFYLARARRTLPALIVMVVVLLVTGWFLLMPSEYQMLGRHARDSLLFTSNLRYLAEAGYFDAASHDKWLLHTWSLSVEWQFYLFYPVIVMLLHRFARQRDALLQLHLLALAASLAFCLYLTKTSPDKAFYWLPSRAWQLLAGGVVFLVAQQCVFSARTSLWMQHAGMALIVGTLLFATPSVAWPGYLAIPCVTGTALILLAHRSGARLLASPVAQWLGTRSYSIYLWHWPLVALFNHYDVLHVMAWKTGGLALSLLLGHLSYNMIETPSQNFLGRRSRRVHAIAITSCIFVVCTVAQAIRTSGFPDRLSADAQAIDQVRQDRNPRQKECLGNPKGCIFGGSDVALLVAGDSHADAMVNAVVAAAPDENQGLYFLGASECLFSQGARRSDGNNDTCDRVRDSLFRADAAYPGTPLLLINYLRIYLYGSKSSETTEKQPRVYFSDPVDSMTPAFLEEFRQDYLDSVCKLGKSRPVYILKPVPDMPTDIPLQTGRNTLRGQPTDIRVPVSETETKNREINRLLTEAATTCGARIIDPYPILCPGGECRSERDGLPIYIDDNHLSLTGAASLTPLFSPLFPHRQHSGQP
jgi:peptidoglycan/LPS O-acetylase OafA/YrhL